MGWPKHRYAWVILGTRRGLYRDNGIGIFIESSRNGFGEVFTDRKVARWIADQEIKWHLKSAGIYRQGHMTADHVRWAAYHTQAAKDIRVLRIALPGTYAQAQIPGRLERNLRKNS